MPRWREVVGPLVERCEVAAAFDMNVTWNPDGAKALGELLKTMADKLDAVVEKIGG